MNSALQAVRNAQTTASTPWWQDAVFYYILVDRFLRAGNKAPLGDPATPAFCGGNLRGVVERLDYLREMGVSALMLSPIQCTANYHGYHITDYEHIDRRFGGMAAFQALLRAAQPDLRIVMDWVPNHVHRTHPFFQAAQQSKKSRYRDWFYFDPQGRYLSFLDYSELPKLNLDHPEARCYIIDCALGWLDLGVTGFRLDHVLGPSLNFWRTFRTAIKNHKPSTYLLGEALFADIQRKHLTTLKLPRKQRHFQQFHAGESVTDAIMLEYTDVFDGVLDFRFQEIMRAEVAHARRRPEVRKVQALLDAHYAQFPAGFSLPSLLDNHDLNRFLFEAKGATDRLKLAARIQFMQAQPPIIYYGTEIGMGQLREIAGAHGDLQARQMMAWDQADKDMLEFYVGLIQARKAGRT